MATWGVRLTASSLAAVGVLAVLGVAFQTRRSRTNAVWEWGDIGKARFALVFGVISVLGGVAVAVSPWRERPVPAGRLLAAQLILSAFAVACALVMLRSGAWLDYMQPVPLP